MNTFEPQQPTNVLANDVRPRLVAEVNDAREALIRLTGEYDLAVTDADVIQEDRDSARQTADQARVTMARAAEALARHDAGVYGICGTCGQPIGDDRLEALPQATTCRACSA